MTASFRSALVLIFFASALSVQAQDVKTGHKQRPPTPRVKKSITAQPLARGGWPGCSECVAENNMGVCYPSYDINDANWSPCTGGQFCYYLPDGTTYCMPYCGGTTYCMP
jgi:hypothetical protein